MKTTSVAYLALAAVAHAHPTVPPVATAGHGMGSGHLNVEIATEAVANEESALPMPTGLNVAACDALTDAYTCQELAACCKDGPTCTAAGCDILSSILLSVVVLPSPLSQLTAHRCQMSGLGSLR